MVKNKILKQDNLQRFVWNKDNLTIGKEKAVVLNIDAITENADWTKMTWDLPKYKSVEFYEWLKFSGMTLEKFKELPVYKWAVKNGTIKEE